MEASWQELDRVSKPFEFVARGLPKRVTLPKRPSSGRPVSSR
jgi:hypothetical protein